MISFLLVVMLVMAESAGSLWVQPFDTLDACRAQLAEAIKLVPQDPAVSYIAVCAPVRNGTSTDI